MDLGSNWPMNLSLGVWGNWRVRLFLSAYLPRHSLYQPLCENLIKLGSFLLFHTWSSNMFTKVTLKLISWSISLAIPCQIHTRRTYFCTAASLPFARHKWCWDKERHVLTPLPGNILGVQEERAVQLKVLDDEAIQERDIRQLRQPHCSRRWPRVDGMDIQQQIKTLS